ncbi:hypothetical protein BB558_004232 [Smittium angustum]|uniref:Uncharacterized protein n=1 Tax=Smittium angustum TaxID=133377 RepID=A0A2U1J3U3_SMIAN|nr:hypothetical protein BB558_004232 [Smittium angustum]
MGISGYEALLFTDILPSVLGIASLRSALLKSKIISTLFLMIGLFAYMYPDPTVRFMIVGLSYGLSTLWLGLQIQHTNSRSDTRVLNNIHSLETGLVLSLVVRMASYTNNPIWPVMNDTNGGWNRLGLILGLVSLAYVIVEEKMIGEYTEIEEDRSFRKNKDFVEVSRNKVKSSKKGWVSGALGFGSWIYVIHSFFSEASILGRWTWDGYPKSGPLPVPWSALVLTAMVLGFSVANRTDITTSISWWIASSISAFVITFYSGWFPFIAGLGFAFYICSISHAILLFVSKCPPGKTLVVGFLVYNILVLGGVWTVAYEFVPGGPLLRERTWVVMLVTMICLYAGVRGAKNVLEQGQVGSAKKMSDTSATPKKSKNEYIGIMWFLSVLGWLVMFWRMPTPGQTPQPHHQEDRIITSAIWTIHFDIDNELWSSEQRILEAVRDLEADVMGFLESDTERIIMGNRDWTQKVSEKLNYYVDYGPSPRKHTWGCAMLSKFPIKKSTHHLLPSPHGELACAIYATLDVFGREVDVVISHNGQEENLLDRQLQTTELARLIKASENPIVFTGYVVTKPKGEIYNLLIDGGNIHDVDPSDHDRWCQYIAYRGLKRIAYARISRGTITDTEIQSAKFIVPKPNENIADFKPSYKRVNESDYPKSHHFPEIFRGEGVRGHFYHVFNEPRYYD